MRLIAVDIDLRRIHAWDEKSGKVCYKEPDLGAIFRHLPTDGFTFVGDEPAERMIVLVEVAGPVSHRDGDARRLHHTHRWMLWNMAKAMELHEYIGMVADATMLVATSTAWTRGHPEKQRHAIACADAPNHDLRECQTMLAFYRLHPSAWKPLPEWLASL